MPASIIDPATGASTWALGSHWCKEYIGSFTKKAASRAILSLWVKVWKVGGRIVDREAVMWRQVINEMRRGKEAVRV